MNKRLELISALIPPGVGFADVGTDHGYLPVHMARHGYKGNIIASDLRATPLSCAVASAREAQVEERIRFVLCDGLDGTAPDSLKTMADDIKAKVENAVIVLAANTDGKITFVAMASKGAVAKGVHAGKIIKEITAVCGGSGGGKPDMAQGGGKDAMKIDDALAKVDEIVKAQIN